MIKDKTLFMRRKKRKRKDKYVNFNNLSMYIIYMYTKSTLIKSIKCLKIKFEFISIA